MPGGPAFAFGNGCPGGAPVCRVEGDLLAAGADVRCGTGMSPRGLITQVVPPVAEINASRSAVAEIYAGRSACRGDIRRLFGLPQTYTQVVPRGAAFAQIAHGWYWTTCVYVLGALAKMRIFSAAGACTARRPCAGAELSGIGMLGLQNRR